MQIVDATLALTLTRPHPCLHCGTPVPVEEFAVVACTTGDNGVIRSSAGATMTPQGAVYCAACTPGVAFCRECGCTQERGCPGGCGWAEPDLCSRCLETDKRCEFCGEALTAEEVEECGDGQALCNDCEEDANYCLVCGRFYKLDSHCRHITYCDEVGSYWGPGSSTTYADRRDDRESLHALFALTERPARAFYGMEHAFYDDDWVDSGYSEPIHLPERLIALLTASTEGVPDCHVYNGIIEGRVVWDFPDLGDWGLVDLGDRFQSLYEHGDHARRLTVQVASAWLRGLEPGKTDEAIALTVHWCAEWLQKHPSPNCGKETLPHG